MIPILSRREAPLVATVLLVALLAAWYAFLLPVGSIQHGDEYLTLDRSASFLRNGDWLTVFSNHEPTFKKPPLQYWMIAALMAQGLDLELAVRLPSFLFGLCVLAATAWLARIALPGERWIVPAAVLLVACSGRFWANSLSGLLDIGATFFATVALAATLSAVRQPRWWWVAALACGLGALQKAPTPLLFVVVPALVLGLSANWTGNGIGRSLRSPHFAGALALALAMVAFWPVLQWLRHGAVSFEQAYMHQMVERFSPFVDSTPSDRRSVFTLLVDGEPIPRILALAAVVWLPFGGARREFVVLPVMIGLYALVAAFAGGIVSPRYSLLFLPAMMTALAAAIFILLANPIHRLAAILLVGAIGLGPVKTASMLDMTGDGVDRLVPIMRSVAAATQPQEVLVTCGKDTDGERLPSGALAYYADAGKPWITVRRPEQLADMAAPLRGLCTTRQYERFAPFLLNPREVEEFDGHVHWTAAGVRGGS